MRIADLANAWSAAPDGDAPAIRLPPTENLLTQGGDARIESDAGRASNRYGCGPRPDPGLLAFGSSTASTISAAGFEAAECLRRRLTASGAPDASVYASELDRTRAALIALCGLDDLPGLDLVLAASGTDLHLIWSRLVACDAAQAPLVVMVDVEETGSGVAAAIAGCHFGARSALGITVTPGAPIDVGPGADLRPVSIRHADGTPREAAAIDAEVASLVQQAAATGKRVLLILVDVSKTGLIAPSPACAAALRRQWPESVEVLIDACQFRIAPATLRAYLQQDFMVAVTGSKFLTGPSFSGALFIPSAVAARLRTRPLPPSLSAYSCRADWPCDWSGAKTLHEAPNFGLLLRWEAALTELNAFRAVPETEAWEFFHAFAQAVRERLGNDARFEPLPVPPLDRGIAFPSDGWDSLPTIFPFLLYRGRMHSGRRILQREETVRISRSLQQTLPGLRDEPLAALRCQLGQAVACGERDGIPVAALRICASARLAVEAASRGRDAVIRDALAVLDKTALLAADGKPG